MKKFITSEPRNDYKIVYDKTGEVVDVLHKLTINDEDDWGKLYLNNLSIICGLTGVQFEVLFGCWKYSSFCESDEGNIIHNTKSFKDKLINEGITSATPDSIDVAISALAKKGILIKMCRGEYLMNPKLFFKGKLANKCKLEQRIIFNSDNTMDKIKAVK